MSVTINIITRVSRKNFFKRCYESVHSQTYKNINHICTYENLDMFDYLRQFNNLNLLRVPPLKRIVNLFYSYNHHDLLDDFVNPDWKFQQKLAHISMSDYRDKKMPVEVKSFGNYDSNPTTDRPKFNHSPYNSYLKMSEKRLKDGWVFYLDDDDYFYDSNFLLNLVEEINKFDNDTIHIFRNKRYDDVLRPSDSSWEKMKSGHPFMLHQIGGSCICFHTDYVDYTVWDEWSGADYRTIKSLEQVIQKKNFTNLIAINYKSRGGNTTDIVDY